MKFKITHGENTFCLWKAKEQEELDMDIALEIRRFIKSSSDTLPTWKLDKYAEMVEASNPKWIFITSNCIRRSRKGKWPWTKPVHYNRAKEIKRILKEFEKIKKEYMLYNKEID